ncbi:MAG: MATE family efflux transporter, partial [Alphaproteobacteria bacterium]|nr:MATE family efflux transporter [Alphaproteobacteria bacterium]
MDPQQENAFLTKPIGPLLTQTAMPIIFVLLMYGMTTVIDIILVGMYVGADAIGALTCVFPIFMVLLALSTLVGNGMASLVARSLGAQDYERANHVYMSAQILALVISALIIGIFLIFGETLVNRAANGSAALIPNAYSYISIILFFSPFQMLLTANSDALRCEGKVQMMALFSILISLANIAFSYSLIV